MRAGNFICGKQVYAENKLLFFLAARANARAAKNPILLHYAQGKGIYADDVRKNRRAFVQFNKEQPPRARDKQNFLRAR